MNVIKTYTFVAKHNHVHEISMPANALFLSAICEKATLIGGKSEAQIIASFYVNNKQSETSHKILSILGDQSMDAYDVFEVVDYLGTAWYAHDGFVTSYYLWELIGSGKNDE
jgi:hypothetical protein